MQIYRYLRINHITNATYTHMVIANRSYKQRDNNCVTQKFIFKLPSYSNIFYDGEQNQMLKVCRDSTKYSRAFSGWDKIYYRFQHLDNCRTKMSKCTWSNVAKTDEHFYLQLSQIVKLFNGPIAANTYPKWGTMYKKFSFIYML